ncbi:flavodoxin family protein [Marispirochaeta sp.]|jgi:multimeric flavodoxin WrbA|uniref:flavodoxin family protein n=1 Tax=Marispirochaeta sp. TaxID=2038653 RepID=UPI0029C7DCA2|nr:flavodoxin family protein [Marispirochaeta sp.]
MRITALVGSRRKNGNTIIIVKNLLKTAEASLPGAETEILYLGDYTIEACTGCEGCRTSWDCVIQDDYPAIVSSIDKADALVLASPTYWYTVSSDMKRFIDRSYSLIQYPVSRHEWISKYSGSGKVCVTVAVCEQHDESMMGSTLTLLNDFSRDLGIEVVASIKALGHFEAGSVKGDSAVIDQAKQAGRKLAEKLGPV